MNHKTHPRLAMALCAAYLVAAAGAAQEPPGQAQSPAPATPAPEAAAPVPAPAPAPAPGDAAPAAAPAEAQPPAGIRFNFKDAPFHQVLDFFSREAGVPIIYEAPAPQETMTFISGETFTFENALTILNLNLQPKGLQLRREKDYLYLGTLKDSSRKATLVARGEVPDDARPEQIINLTIPLANSRAETVAEQIKPLIAEYGSVTAVPPQNMLIVVETAAQCRRILSIVSSIDGIKPIDSAYRLFPIKHAKADAVFNALKGLVGQRKTTVIYDKDNKPRTLEEIDIAGLNLQPDPRINAIIAVGPEARIRVVEELIALIDVPEGGPAGTHQMMTFALEAVAPQQAAQQLNALFAKVEGAQKPTVLPIPENGKVTVVGPAALLAQAAALIAEIDPGSRQGAGSAQPERRAAVIRLKNLSPAAVEQFAGRLLTSRQAAILKYGPGSDGKSLIVTGPDADVAAFEQIVTGIDSATEPSREIRQVRIAQGEPAAILGKVNTLWTATDQSKAEPVAATLDAESRTITLVGSRVGVDRFSELLRSTESSLVIDQVRIIPLANADAGELAATIQALMAPLRPGEIAPVLRVDRPSNALLVRATPEQMTGIEEMARKLDAATTDGARQMRMVTVDRSRADAALMAETLKRLLEQQNGVKVDIITVDELLGRPEKKTAVPAQPPPGEPEKPTTHGDATPSAGGGMPLSAAAAMFGASALRIIDDPPKTSVTIAVDPASNSLIVVGPQRAADRAAALAAQLERQMPPEPTRCRIVELPAGTEAEPIANLIRQTVQQIGRAAPGNNGGFTGPVVCSSDPAGGALIIWANETDFQGVTDLIRGVSQIGNSAGANLPVRYLKLERADATTVATALQKFFTDRAAASPRAPRRASAKLAIAGDKRSGTLIVACTDEDFAEIQTLVSTFDAPAKARELSYKVVPLQHARVADIRETLENIAEELRWERMGAIWSGRGNEAGDDKVFVHASEQVNSVILMGQGDALETMTKMIAELDRPAGESAKLLARAVQVERGDLRALAEMIRQVTATPGWRFWRGPDPDAVFVQVDAPRRMLLLIGKKERVDQAAAYLEDLKTAAGKPDTVMETITLKHAPAGRAADTIRRVLTERAQAAGQGPEGISVIGSADGNLLVITAEPPAISAARDLLAMIDQPELGKDRQIEVFVVRNREADEIASLVRAQFPRGGRPESQVIVTPQPSTNSVIVSALGDDVPHLKQLIETLDSPPTAESTKVVTISLKSARADEVAQGLRSALPQGLKVKITPIRRNNTLLVTGSDENVKLVLAQVAQIDVQLDRPLVEVKRIKLQHALAFEVAWTVDQMIRARPTVPGEPEATIDYTRSDNTVTYSGTADQVRDIDRMIETLDVATQVVRKTEFVKLEFAKAENTAKALEVFYGRFAPDATPAARNVTIVPDPASNSLVVSAEESQWPGLRELLKKLDTEEYDTSRQLAVIPLKHADASSVSRALNEGFRAPVESRFRREQARQQNQGRGQRPQEETFQPLVLVDNEPTPTVSAEPQTNSLVVFAGRQDMQRIRALVTQIDVPDFQKFPQAHVLPLATGKASQIAGAVRELFANQPRTGAGAGGPRAVVIVGDDTSNSLIIRAEEEDFAQIKALAEVLQQQGDRARAAVRVLTLKNIPAARLQRTLATTFTQTARQRNEVLAVEVDRSSNSLVIASSGPMFEEIEKTVRELDGTLPGPDGQPPRAGVPGMAQSVFIIDVQNNSPEEVRRQLEQLGVTRPQPEDRPGIVSEPVTIVPLLSRRALVVVASPQDGEALVSLVRALDAAPAEGDQKIAIVGLKLATASALVTTLRGMLNPADQAAKTGPAAALAEQVRRLSVARNGLEKTDPTVDLAKPIRLIADDQTNSVIIGSTPENVASLTEVIKVLDTLPLGEAVLVRVFPLSNASATRVKGVIDDLFRQGDGLRRLPGTRRQGLPTTATGKALAGEIAVTVDERTNTLIAAGRDEAVALVEVLIRDLDSDQAAKWVEPTLIPLKHADAATLATTLRQVLVQGMTVTPEALGLQRQIGRLRLLKTGGKLDDPASRIQADLFAPLTGLVITPEPQLNALIVVGSPANNEIVRELVGMLDVEAAAASNTVRMFPLQRAAADRVAAIVGEIFRQRQTLPSARPEDRLVIVPDMRTNALVVSTSQTNFSILEAMLGALDSDQANATVGLHVIPITGVDAASIAPRIANLMRERIAAAQRTGEIRSPLDAFSIEADAASNLLIVASSDENLQVVKELITSLSKGNPALFEGMRTELITLKSGRASEAALTVRELYVEKENARRGREAVSIIPNERLNALVAMGTEADIAEIRRLIDRLENADIGTAQDIRRIGLRSANALEVVGLLQNILAGRTVSGSNDIAARQATNIRFFREKLAQNLVDRIGGPPTEAQVDGAIREQVTLTPDLRTNSVMVKAPSQVMAVIQAIIEDLDTTTAGARRIEQFTLKNADVRAMADLLRDIFTLRQQGNKYVLVPTMAPTEIMGPDGPMPGGTAPTLTPVPDERQELSIAIDARTNTLIVSGTDEYLIRVKQVVQDLDAIEALERRQEVYAVKNAKAKDIEATLAAYFRGESGLERATLSADQAGAAMRRLEQEVTVVGDEKSNKLVISTSPRYMDMVLDMVQELDAAPPQVVIQVLLAEVTLDNADTWGADVRLKNIGGDGLNIASLAAGAGVASALGIPNLTFASNDFELLLRSLEAQGKLQVLSRPSVTARNNEPATIQVGDNIAIVTNVSTFFTGGSQQANVERRDIGIILNVTPSISPDGFVRMDLKPEISSLSSRTTQISADFAAPVITQRKVQTVITVKDGQTVVIGGLIQTTQQERRTKMPLLGDLPLVGGIFRSHQDSDVKTELLMIVTPKVIYNDSPEGVDRFRRISERKIDALENPRAVRDALKRDNMEDSVAYPPPAAPEAPASPEAPAPAHESGAAAPTPGLAPPLPEPAEPASASRTSHHIRRR
ncbi:MAG: secretin N-terminal domain-containing protein [Phycisphaerales bacterium]